MEINETSEDWDATKSFPGATNRETPFSVPEAYFDNLPDQIMSRIMLDEMGFKEQNSGFNVPAAYFDDLSVRIESAVTAETWKDLKTENAFSVPGDYFEKSAKRISQAVAVPLKDGKVRSMYLNLFKYASAACVLIVTAFFFYSNHHNANLDEKFSELPGDDIVNYLQISTDAGDAPVIMDNISQVTIDIKSDNGVSDKDIRNYLEATSL